MYMFFCIKTEFEKDFFLKTEQKWYVWFCFLLLLKKQKQNPHNFYVQHPASHIFNRWEQSHRFNRWEQSLSGGCCRQPRPRTLFYSCIKQSTVTCISLPPDGHVLNLLAKHLQLLLMSETVHCSKFAYADCVYWICWHTQLAYCFTALWQFHWQVQNWISGVDKVKSTWYSWKCLLYWNRYWIWGFAANVRSWMLFSFQ